MQAAQTFFFLALLAVFAIGSVVWSHSRSTSLIQDWARANGFTILSSERRYFFSGPFFFRSSKGQSVYYVTIQDQDQHVRHAYIRCGGWFFGLMSDTVKVEWDASR